MNECSILWCGKYHQNWENELHCHNYFQMVGILSGSGTVYVDDQPYEIEKEQVFLLCPQQLHAIHCGEKNAAPLKMLDVKFTVADPALFEDLVRVGDMFHLQDFGWFVRFFDKIIAESAQQRPYYYSIISGYLLEMLVRIVRERLGQPAAAPEEEAPRVATFKGVDVAALMQYIDFNYSRIISLEDLSTLAGVNKTTLISIFKEVYGTTPIRYINRIRLRKAKELLVNTDTSVSEIADLVGFSISAERQQAEGNVRKTLIERGSIRQHGINESSCLINIQNRDKGHPWRGNAVAYCQIIKGDGVDQIDDQD